MYQSFLKWLQNEVKCKKKNTMPLKLPKKIERSTLSRYNKGSLPERRTVCLFKLEVKL